MHDTLIWQDGRTAIDYPIEGFAISGDSRAAAKAEVLISTEMHSIRWPVADIAVQDIPPATIIVSCKGHMGRLVASGTEADLVRSVLRSSNDWLGTKHRRRGKLALGIMAILATCVMLWFGWPGISDRLVNIIPPRADSAIGDALLPLLADSERRCTSPVGTAALEQILTRLRPHTPTPVPLHVFVIDSPTVNAMAVPGGTIIVYRGLLNAAQSPEEIAGVLAHEIGHQSYRHGMRGLVRHAGLAVVISLLDPSGGLLGSVTTHLTQTAHGRGFEEQADEYAVEALQAAQIGTFGLREFFTRLHQKHGSTTGMWRYAQTHPPLVERMFRTPPRPSALRC